MKRVQVLDSLRGIAALAVMWFHFTSASQLFPKGLIETSGSRGYLGVEVFFVISGFVIPYALHSSNYRISNYLRFVLKRIVRLDPPYIVSLGLVLILGYLAAATPGYLGKPFQPSLIQILLHMGYVNVFFGYPWLNGIYWTLAIELQYYLMIGLLFPLIHKYWIPLFTILGTLAFLIPSETFIFRYLFLFMIGIVTFRYHLGMSSRLVYFMVILILTSGVYLTLGGWIAGAGLFATLVIAFVRWNPLRFFGMISYSLYLVHLPVGGKLINLSVRLAEGTASKMLIVLLATSLSIFVAYLLYRLVEKPSQRWAGSILYEVSDGSPTVPSNLVIKMRTAANADAQSSG